LLFRSYEGLNLKEALTSVPFFQMVIMMGSFLPAPGLITTFYKTFGQTFINNDKFLSIVGSTASFFNALGRLFWGFLIDKLSFKVKSSFTLLLQF
jgi:hypothetical protein